MFRTKKDLLKIPILGVVKLASTLIMQRFIGNPIWEALGLREPETGPPATFFLVSISIIGFITGCTYAAAYRIIGQKIAIKNHSLRAIIFGLFIYFGNYFAQAFGVSGASGPNALTVFQWDHAIFDFFAYLITFAVCGTLFKTEEVSVKSAVSMKGSIAASVVCGIAFPLLMFVSTQATELLLPTENLAAAMRIAPEAATDFYSIFYACFILSGVSLPLLYIHTEYKSAARHKAAKFACVYAIFIWIPVVFAMFAFGISLAPLVLFSLESFIVILVTTLLANKILHHFYPSIPQHIL